MPILPYIDRGLRRATAPFRSLPQVLIIGAMRCGTTALYTWLADHPELSASAWKEIHYFDFHFDRGTNWYRAFFPMVGSKLAIDASPSYLNHPDSAHRAATLLPGAVAIALLRDPVERAWSQYRFRRDHGRESRSFREIVESELREAPPAMMAYQESAHIPYLAAGLYSAQLTPWFQEFGRDSVLVLDSHVLFEDPDPVLEQVQQFIGVTVRKGLFAKVNAATSEEAPPDVLAILREYYATPNQELARMLDPPPSWVG